MKQINNELRAHYFNMYPGSAAFTTDVPGKHYLLSASVNNEGILMFTAPVDKSVIILRDLDNMTEPEKLQFQLLGEWVGIPGISFLRHRKIALPLFDPSDNRLITVVDLIANGVVKIDNDFYK